MLREASPATLGFVIHSDPEIAGRVAAALEAAGFRIGRATAPAVARQLLAVLRPEVTLVEVAMLRRDEAALYRWWQAEEGLAGVPVVALANGRPESRRDALRLGFTNVLTEPLEAEELVLATRAALGLRLAGPSHAGERDERPAAAGGPPGGDGTGSGERGGRQAGGGEAAGRETAGRQTSGGGDLVSGPGHLRGSLSHLPVADLLSMIELNRRTGRIELRRSGVRAILVYEAGEPVSALLSDGRRGKEALAEVLAWRSGSFVAHLHAVGEAPDEGSGEAAALALKRAEADVLFARRERKEGAAEPWRGAVQRTLAVLNLALSYTVATAGPDRAVATAERHRQRLEATFPALALFELDDAGTVTLRRGAKAGRQAPKAVEGACRLWLQDLFDDLALEQPEEHSRRVLDRFVASAEAFAWDGDASPATAAAGRRPAAERDGR